MFEHFAVAKPQAQRYNSAMIAAILCLCCFNPTPRHRKLRTPLPRYRGPLPGVRTYSKEVQ